MLFLLASASPAGTLAVGASDTANLQAVEDPTSDFFIVTLDDAFISASDVAGAIVQQNRSDFVSLTLGESAGLITGATTAKPVTDTTSLAADDVAVATVVAVVNEVTDTASLTLTESGSVEIGQIGVEVTDDASLSLDDAGASSVAADVERDGGDTASLFIEDRARIVNRLPVAFIRFEPQPDRIVFTSP